jgi:hypothetical protein
VKSRAATSLGFGNRSNAIDAKALSTVGEPAITTTAVLPWIGRGA